MFLYLEQWGQTVTYKDTSLLPNILVVHIKKTDDNILIGGTNANIAAELELDKTERVREFISALLPIYLKGIM